MASHCLSIMKIVSRSQFWSLAALLAADTVFFATTDPHEVPSFILIIGFLLLTATIYCAVRGLLALIRWYGLLPSDSHRRRLARVVTGLAAGLIALQSIGQLGVRDILVLLPLTLLAYLYITYGRVGKRGASSATTY